MAKRKPSTYMMSPKQYLLLLVLLVLAGLIVAQIGQRLVEVVSR